MKSMKITPKRPVQKSGYTSTNQRGFTLIELVIVVAIIGLLTVLAYPSFTEQIRNTRRAELAQHLMQCAAVLERRFTVNNGYESTGCDGLAPSLHYSIGITTPSCTSNGNNTCFIITAIASSTFMQKDSACKTYTYDHLGVRTAFDIDDLINTQNCW